MQQPSAPSTVDAVDAAGQFAKRRRTALWFTMALLVLSLIILVSGLAAGACTGNVDVAGYYPGIILSFGSFLALVGINLVENRRPMDRRPLSEGRCQFYSSGSGYAYDNYHTEVLCYTFSSKCKLRVKSNTCYCCDLYNCESPERYSKYYEYTGVSSCMDASHLYRLLWASVVLNVLGLFLGIVTAAILGAFKDIKPVSQINCSSAPPPSHILYNPAQQVLTYAGFCPSNQALPAYPNYPLPVQHQSSFQAPSSADTPLPDDSQAPSSYVLSPNAPSLYTPPYNPGDKPPPYAS
ncbi:transmembrane protein 255B-like isoform X2 [Polyodon spathula]|uniref:transmembrane protein 255B-like isoform X2 n=1 Tax=Polyodon spathula TaxID=7913 RepID=UPI001B7E37F9|nr:transmembrane protein 255B-like isoform X2 [Polyodon spathula]